MKTKPTKQHVEFAISKANLDMKTNRKNGNYTEEELQRRWTKVFSKEFTRYGGKNEK